MIDENDDLRISEVVDILFESGERGIYSAARAVIAWHENKIEVIKREAEKRREDDIAHIYRHLKRGWD